MRALVVLLLVAATPTASACSWAVPELLDRLDWHPARGLVGTTELFWTGPVDLVHASVASRFPEAAALSPDGRHVAFPRVGPDVQVGPGRMWDSCEMHLSRHLVGWDLANATFVVIDEGPIWSMGATDEGVVTYRERETRVYRWDDWTLLRSERGATGAEPLSWRNRLPDPAVAKLHREGIWPSSAARSPDGEHLAIVAPVDGGRYDLRIHRAADLALVANVSLGRDHARLAWGPAGLAAILAVPAEENATPVVRLYREPLAIAGVEERAFEGERAGSLAWSPDGSTLAASFPRSAADARLVLLDADLDVVRDDEIRLVVREADPLEGLDALPIPGYTLAEEIRATPAPGLALALVALAALARGLSRRG